MATQYSEPILIVEDDRNTASLVAAYLQREGFATTMVHDGREALRAARRQPPLLVILDVMLPNVDGWGICKQLRSRSDVPILMLTAREEEIDRVLGLTLGADDYVVKPLRNQRQADPIHLHAGRGALGLRSFRGAGGAGRPCLRGRDPV